MKPVVAHLTNGYLPLTQTWLYHNQIINLKRYEPIVIAQSTMNLDKFPTQNAYSIPKRSIISKIFNMIHIKLTGSYKTRYFENIIKENNVELLHAHFGTEGVRYLKLKKNLDIPLITTFYGSDVSMNPKKSYCKKQYIRLFKEGNLFLTEGNNMKQELIKLGCPENKIIIQHLGVDLTTFNFTPRTLPEDGNIVILIAGSFREKKRHPLCDPDFFKSERGSSKYPIESTRGWAPAKQDRITNSRVRHIRFSHIAWIPVTRCIFK